MIFDTYQLKESTYKSIYDGSLVNDDTFSEKFENDWIDNQYNTAVLEENENGDMKFYASNKENKDKKIESITWVNPNNAKNEELKAITNTITDKERNLANKNRELAGLKAKLSNTQEYFFTSSSDSKKLQDYNKLKYLDKASRLVRQYYKKPLKDWSSRDRALFKGYASRLGIDVDYGKGREGKAEYLHRQLRAKQYSFLKDKYAIKIETNTTKKRNVNPDYKNTKTRIAGLKREINGINQALTSMRSKERNVKNNYNRISSVERWVVPVSLPTASDVRFLSREKPISEMKMDDVNNTTKVEITESNDPENSENNSGPGSNTSSTDWGGFFSNSGDDRNGSQTANYTGLETSNNGQSEIVSGVNTTLVIESHIDESGNGVNYRGLTIETGAKDHFEDVFSDGQGRYSYTGWGEWNGSSIITSSFGGPTQIYTINHGFWVAGNETSSKDMPKIGRASYSGLAVGDLQRNGVTLRGGVSGTVGFNMDFANETFTGNMRLTDIRNSTWANPQISGVVDKDDADFRSTSMTGVRNGNMNGNFYGVGAKEVGGAWSIENHNGEHASGVFKAK